VVPGSRSAVGGKEDNGGRGSLSRCAELPERDCVIALVEKNVGPVAWLGAAVRPIKPKTARSMPAERRGLEVSQRDLGRAPRMSCCRPAGLAGH
jgi:hypothetical protein